MSATPRLGWFAAAITLTLCGCQQDAKKPAAKAEAGGEILPGSASDAMLPYDTVKSQPPLAPRTDTGDGDKGGERKDTGKKADDAAAPATAAPAAPATGEAPPKAE